MDIRKNTGAELSTGCNMIANHGITHHAVIEPGELAIVSYYVIIYQLDLPAERWRTPFCSIELDCSGALDMNRAYHYHKNLLSSYNDFSGRHCLSAYPLVIFLATAVQRPLRRNMCGGFRDAR